MISLTKAKVTGEQVEYAVKKHFGLKALKFCELNDGYYNISYLVTLENESEVVLKVAPPNNVDVLTYEKDIIKTEIHLYKLTDQYTDIKVPKILAQDFSQEIIPSPYYFMSKIDGIALNKINKLSKDMRMQVYKKIAEYMAKLHNIRGENFGYITMADKCKDMGCLNSLVVSVEAIIHDAKRKDIKLPFAENEIYAVFKSAEKAFKEIGYPVACHYDLWDGNIFVNETQGNLEVTGIIDFERGFFACPAADFCQIIHNVDFKKDRYFLEEYNKFADKKLEYDNALEARIWAYRFYLFLIMHVECDYRDINGSFEHQRKWVASEIGEVYRKFKRVIKKMD